MFGTFRIRADYMSEPVEFSLTGRSRRLWTLTAYLIANKERGIPAQELVEVLWPVSAGKDPLSRLQNNVSRTRASLLALGFKDAQNLIRCENGLYYWAPGYKLVVDTDVFEKNMAEIKQRDMDEKTIKLAQKSLLAYEGDFLGKAISEAWAVNFATYYSSVAMSTSLRLVTALMERERYQEAQHACIRSLTFDPSVEDYSILLMRAYVAQGEPQKALDHYAHIKNLLHDLYEVSPSLEIEAEREAAIQAIHGSEISAQEVQDFLSADGFKHGAFYCSNSMFREIVQLHIREVKRYGTQAQLAILSIRTAGTSSSPNTESNPERQTLHLKRLRSTVSETLRESDPFTKMSSSQLLILLPGATRQTASIAIERVLDTFRNNYPYANVELVYSLLDLAELA